MDTRKERALTKRYEDACHNSANAEEKCSELREKLFLSEKHWYKTKDTLPQVSHFKGRLSEYRMYVYGAFSNGENTWGRYTLFDNASKSFDGEEFNADETKVVRCYAWMYLPDVPSEEV